MLASKDVNKYCQKLQTSKNHPSGKIHQFSANFPVDELIQTRYIGIGNIPDEIWITLSKHRGYTKPMEAKKWPGIKQQYSVLT
jgi:hypothetical protein